MLMYCLTPLQRTFFSTKRTGVNFGLGLSFVNSVMEQHKGKLEILSTAGVGTDIVLSFPQKTSFFDAMKIRHNITTG
jgi:phosphoglycerate-specific signal transduction histidine kinase